MNVYREENLPFPTVYGSAYSGFGVVAQSIDNGDQEFPSGSISLQEGTIEGYVTDGMGVSTNTVSLNSYETEPVKLIGTAENGIGISTCMINSSANYFVQGISRGASTNHFQVYNAIPDSAGINALSYFMLHGDGEIIGEAPEDIIDSFGIHSFLPYEGGYVSGTVSLYNSANESIKLTATGHTGLWTTRLDLYSEGEIQMQVEGAKDGIVTTSMTSYGQGETAVLAKGDTGSGLRIFNEWTDMRGNFTVGNLQMEATGGQFGMHISTDEEARIENSNLSGIATGDDAVAGIFFQSGIYPERSVRDLMIQSSALHAESSKIGLLFQNYKVAVDAKDYILPVPGMMEGIGSEIGIGFDYSPEFLPEYQAGTSKALTTSQLGTDESAYIIRGISKAMAPDIEGRKAAVALPSASWDGGGLLEERYEISAVKPVNPEIPYAVYAKGMNLSDYTGFSGHPVRGQ